VQNRSCCKTTLLPLLNMSVQTGCRLAGAQLLQLETPPSFQEIKMHVSKQQ
jgi:hypothetical protein